MPVGNQQPDRLVLVGAADADVEEPAHVAQGDLALGAHPVVADPAVVGWRRRDGMRLEHGVEGD